MKIAGLGNRSIVSDAIGPMTAEGITANRHIKESDPSLFEKLRSLPISAVIPGVTGQTGMEALELIKGASAAVKPSVMLNSRLYRCKYSCISALPIEICCKSYNRFTLIQGYSQSPI